eukprot:7966153-Pyramimonas_sp.AAC.1
MLQPKVGEKASLENKPMSLQFFNRPEKRFGVMGAISSQLLNSSCLEERFWTIEVMWHFFGSQCPEERVLTTA